MESETENSHPTALSTLRSNGLIIVLVFVSMFLGMLPIVRYVLLPFEFFTTFIHEGSHAIASLLMGESVNRIVINPDTSGYMQHTASGGALAQGFISSAGYVGAALFGGGLIVVSAYKKMSKILLFSLGIVFLLAIVLYVRDFFSLGVCGLLAASLLLIAVKGGPYLNFFALNFLAVQCALNSFGDVMTLVKISLGAPKSAYSLGHSDADAVAQAFFLPAIVWSILWMAISGVILYLAMKKSARLRASQSN
jgi:hypothetical protein